MAHHLFIYDHPLILQIHKYQNYKTPKLHDSHPLSIPPHALLSPHNPTWTHQVNTSRPARASRIITSRALENFALVACELPPLYIGHHHASSSPAPISVFRFVFDPGFDVPLIGPFDLLDLKMEPMDIVGKTKEDASLPKATMTKIIKEMLPPDVRVARDTQDLLIECCVEFINLVSSESNEVCSREDKRTIAPEHVLKALEVLGFGDYIEEVYAAYEQHKLETVDTVRGGKCTNGAEMTEEEALAEQQRMFAEARARMNGIATAAPKPPPEAEPSLNSST